MRLCEWWVLPPEHAGDSVSHIGESASGMVATSILSLSITRLADFDLGLLLNKVVGHEGYAHAPACMC